MKSIYRENRVVSCSFNFIVNANSWQCPPHKFTTVSDCSMPWHHHLSRFVNVCSCVLRCQAGLSRCYSLIMSDFWLVYWFTLYSLVWRVVNFAVVVTKTFSNQWTDCSQCLHPYMYKRRVLSEARQARCDVGLIHFSSVVNFRFSSVPEVNCNHVTARARHRNELRLLVSDWTQTAASTRKHSSFSLDLQENFSAYT